MIWIISSRSLDISSYLLVAILWFGVLFPPVFDPWLVTCETCDASNMYIHVYGDGFDVILYDLGMVWG